MASVETVEGGENPGRSACWESVSVRAPHQPVTESSYCSWSAGEERQEAGERNRKEGNGRESMEGVGGESLLLMEGRAMAGEEEGRQRGVGGSWGRLGYEESVPGSQLQASPVVLGRGVREG